MAHPRLREAFLELAKYSKDLEVGTPALKEKGLFVRSAVDLQRPELVTAARRLSGASRRDSDTASLTGDAALENGTRETEGADAYGNHPALGPFPAELKFHYPLGQTEAASTVPAVPLEASARRLKDLGYKKVLTKKRKAPRSRRTRPGASPSPPSSSTRSR